jgi:ferredoxin
MVNKKVRLIYFSPTGTSRKIVESIAEGIASENVEQRDLTLAADVQQSTPPFSDELVIMAAPVYAGRLPVDAINRFNRLKAKNTLAVIVVLYGNREFEDALLELNNLAMRLGFMPIAAGAFIGEHSFSSESQPIAEGRPDTLDIEKAVDFGRRIKEKVAALQSIDVVSPLKLPGHFPYQADRAGAMAVSPVTVEEKCTVCGVCADLCPTEAITINDSDSVVTEVERCIRCCACIKSCPEDARVIEADSWKKIVNWLYDSCTTRKEPQIFGIDG